jgi:hypothetical protein
MFGFLKKQNKTFSLQNQFPEEPYYNDITENADVTAGYTIGTISPEEIAAADKMNSIPWKQRAKGWNPYSGLPPVFKEIPANTTVCKYMRISISRQKVKI